MVDASYDYALIIHFDNQEAHDAYQVDPIHLKFVDDHKADWERVTVYDSATELNAQ